MPKTKKQVKIKSNMAKPVKKAVKVAKKVVKIVNLKLPVIPVQNVCPACQGSGLWRPDFTNSPQCDQCKGHGVIN